MIHDLSKLIKHLTTNKNAHLFLSVDMTALRVCGPCRRPMKNSSSSPVFLKIKKTEEMSQPSQNGERTDQRTEKTQESSSQQRQQKESLSDAGGRESTFPEEDPERMKHSKVNSLLS